MENKIRAKYAENNIEVLFIKLNGEGKFHNENGPALVLSNGTVEFRKNGKLHNENGPASIELGFIEFWIDGKRHNTKGPAIISSDGTTHWFINGKMVNEDGSEYKNRAEFWYISDEERGCNYRFVREHLKPFNLGV